MKLNVSFLPRKNHSWLRSGNAIELFLAVDNAKFQMVNGQLATVLPSSVKHEIDADCGPSGPGTHSPHAMFLCDVKARGTTLYHVSECVVHAGGDSTLFVQKVGDFRHADRVFH